MPHLGLDMYAQDACAAASPGPGAVRLPQSSIAEGSYPTLPTLSRPIVPYPTLSYHILPYPTLSYPILPHPTLPYPILAYPSLS